MVQSEVSPVWRVSRVTWAGLAISLTISILSLVFGYTNARAADSDVPQGRAEPSILRFGDVDLRECSVVVEKEYRSWCGRIVRPLDLSDLVTGGQSISIRFAVILPRPWNSGAIAELQRSGALVGLEGGPGYGAIEAAWAYTDVFAPMLSRRALVLMDARGTGRSHPIDCRSFGYSEAESPAEVDRSTAMCGASLGNAIDDYGTTSAMDDLAAIIRALGFSKADVYGGSYGSFAAQVLAAQHPELVRSLILDGAYPVSGETAWYPTQGAALRSALQQVCRQDVVCAGQNQDTVEILSAALRQLREKPVSINAPGDDGRRHRVVIDPPSLVEVAFGGTYGTTVYRELDPALRAFLQGDPLPLGRLVAEQQYLGASEESIQEYSHGQFLAVSCQDYPQLFDMASSARMRQVQFDSAVAQAEVTDPDMYAPFRISEYLNSAWQIQDLCLSWPVLPLGGFGPPTSGPYPDIPTLVFSGSLDTITTAAEGEMVAQQFPRSLHVIVQNGVHVQALGAMDSCATRLIEEFISSPEVALTSGDEVCIEVQPRLTKSFIGSGRALGTPQATAITVADVLNRVRMSARNDGLGLRSGTWRLKESSNGSGYRITLQNIRVFADLPVSGVIDWRSNGNMRAHIDTPDGRLKLAWNTQITGAQAQVRGTLNGQAVRTEFMAP